MPRLRGHLLEPFPIALQRFARTATPVATAAPCPCPVRATGYTLETIDLPVDGMCLLSSRRSGAPQASPDPEAGNPELLLVP